jgi:hypothetical protein
MLIEEPELYGKYADVILKFLNADSIEEIEYYEGIEIDEDGEDWQLPEGFIIDNEIYDAKVENLVIGYLAFGHLSGRPMVAERNASPFCFYTKRVNNV